MLGDIPISGEGSVWIGLTIFKHGGNGFDHTFAIAEMGISLLVVDAKVYRFELNTGGQIAIHRLPLSSYWVVCIREPVHSI